MGLTIGGSGIGTNSMIGGIGGNQNGTNNSNMGMYAQNNEGENLQVPHSANGANGSNNTGSGNQNANADIENVGEDLLMMNIPREGNADQLNKSTKLTLSSKK